MFGHIMEFDVGEMRIRMAPLSREDMPQFVQNGGMQSLNVARYLGRSTAPVIEDEYEWYEKQRTDQTQVGWGLYVLSESEPVLIGTSGFSGIATNTMFRRGTSGYLCFRPEYWGRGIAGHSHRARTAYAFNELGLSCIYSGAYDANAGSSKALESVGYVQTGINRNAGMHAGRFLHHIHYECINPADWAWSAWWGDDEPGEQWLAARERTEAALQWAAANVTYP